MKLIGKEKLIFIQNSGHEGKKWISLWSTEMYYAKWKDESALFKQYPKAITEGNNTFLFIVGNLGFLVRVKISFIQGIVLIESVSSL